MPFWLNPDGIRPKTGEMVFPSSSFCRPRQTGGVVMSLQGFTILEMCMVVFILGLILSIAVPSLTGMRDQNLRLHCLSNQRQIQSAKDAFTLDHLGEYYASGTMPDDRMAVFRSYFVEGFTDQAVCPKTGVGYDGLYDTYYRTGCATCGSDEMGSPL